LYPAGNFFFSLFEGLGSLIQPQFDPPFHLFGSFRVWLCGQFSFSENIFFSSLPAFVLLFSLRFLSFFDFLEFLESFLKLLFLSDFLLCNLKVFFFFLWEFSSFSFQVFFLSLSFRPTLSGVYRLDLSHSPEPPPVPLELRLSIISPPIPRFDFFRKYLSVFFFFSHGCRIFWLS